MRYTKPPLTISDQIKLLKSRGLIIDDLAKAESYLSNVSYYRMSGFMYPFKNLDTDQFIGGVNFETIIDLYHFDRELRVVVFDAIESLEIAFRTQMIYQQSIVSDAFWFEDNSNFLDSDRLTDHLAKLDEEINRSSEVFIEHFRNKYTAEETPPAWMAFELISFGLLSKFYQNLKDSLPAKKKIAAHFGIMEPRIFQSWIRSMTYVRNVCAHHSRLWNRVLTNRPAIYHKPPGLWIPTGAVNNQKIYYFLCCITYMLRAMNPRTNFVSKLKSVLNKHPNIPKTAMGFPENWEEENFWK